jgi:RNA polymerase sigma-70 factor (ECF subfamily)
MPVTGEAHAETDAETDAEVIEVSLREPERFAVLYDRHHQAIHRYIARRLGRDRADDLMSETFLIAFGRRDHYDLSYSSARPWLFGIATNLIGQHRRAEDRFWRLIARTGVDEAVRAGIAPRPGRRARQVAAWTARRAAADRCRRPVGGRDRVGPGNRQGHRPFTAESGKEENPRCAGRYRPAK